MDIIVPCFFFRRLKRRGVLIESEIEYRVGPYFVLAVNVLSVDWTRLVKMSYRDAVERRAKWIKAAESDESKDGVTRRHGPLASLMRLFRMTSIEVLAGILAALYHTHWIVYTPLCWFLYRFLIGELFRKYFLSSVTDGKCCRTPKVKRSFGLVVVLHDGF